MKRINPIGSLLGLIMTSLLFVGFGISLWFDRGLAFSPGPVSAKNQAGVNLEGFASHADFEKQCGKCHDPLRTNLATKCLECHTMVKEQIQGAKGAHGQIDTINDCAACHPEHRGREFDPTLASFQKFDHSKTRFSLNWHQENYDATPMQCSECHKQEAFAVVDNQTCLDCHAGHDDKFALAHLQNFGPDCKGCHDGVDRMQNYDHNQTGFALEGKHGQVKCIDCHNTNSVKDTPLECTGCHGEPSIHRGIFAQSCETCHTAESWTPAKVNDQPFGHLETAGFSLVLHQVDYAQQAINCDTCHPNDLQTFDIQTCIDCHSQQDSSFISDHIQQFGAECMVCHDGVDRLSNFQHANFFPLDGLHASIQCTDCHFNQVYRGTPTECWQCHPEPEIHAGIFGLKCDYCHDASVWSPASLRQHVFPLLHGEESQQTQLQCDTCHGNNYVDYTCFNCHDHQAAEIEKSHREAGITAQELPACAKCHPDGILTDEQKKP